MPAQPSLAAPRDFPGRRHLHSVPFGGKSGLRKLPKVRPKLSKIQKKALKWASKHPEGDRPAMVARVLATTTTIFQDALQGFIGQPATPTTFAGVQQAVQVYVDNYLYTGTGGNVYPATYTAITTNVTTASTTVNLPMWTAWNANWAPTGEWAHWQGQGNQADLQYNPNDRVQRERLRQERTLQTEAQYQQQRMERAAREAENTRLWEAGAPERAAAAARRAVADAAEQEARKTALKRSYDLLFRHLTDDQKNMLESENRFLITAQSRRMYEIRRGLMHNIFRLDDQGRAIEELCCYIPGVPEGDSLLGQMLHLMANEDDFRRTANRWELRDMSPVDRRLPAAGRVRPTEVGRILVGRSLEGEPQRRVA